MAAQKKTFEGLYSDLEEATRRLEQGNMPLEDSLKLYEQGADIVAQLREILDAAELHVKTLQVRLQPPVVPDEPAAAQSDDSAFDDSGVESMEVYEYEDDPSDE